MMLHNYILNGEGQLLIEAKPETLQVNANAGIACGTAPNPKGSGWWPEIKSFSNVTTAIPSGVVPGWGCGPGVGANSTVQILDRDFHDTRWPNNPERLFWIGWNAHPNPADGCQASGWEPGAVNPDGSPRNDCPHPWRITIFEQGIKRCEELLGQWVGYSFFVLAGSNALGAGDFPVRPLIMTGYGDGNFFLHNLTVEVVATQGVVRECCGWFQIPPIPAGKTVNREQFGMQFGVDTTCKTPPPILMTGFKLCRWPYPTTPTEAPENIKYLVEKEPMSTLRQRASWFTVEP
jgi:hypothetical protein